MSKTKAPKKATSTKSRKHPGTLAKKLYLKEGYAKSSDGTKIYYQSIGQGSPIVLCNGMGVGTFFWKYFQEDFKDRYQVVTWDYRGHGASEVPKNPDHSRVEDLVDDCLAVTKALGLQKPIFIGHSLGSLVIFEFYRRYPTKVRGLVSCFGTFGRPMDFFYNSPLSRHIFEILTTFGLYFPGPSNWISRLLVKNPFSFQMGGILKLVNTGLANKEDMDQYINHIVDRDPLFFTKLSRNVQNHSSEDLLDKIKVPTLIIAGEEDIFTPAWIGKKMHRIIPDSELFVIRKGSHAALIEQPDLINLRIEKFLKERVEKNKAKRSKTH
ncbi:MAG: alpha/beta hydrolase [Deltaproteobacteria bacterium]|nr:alpha/beta hydrolase [Deltaproteobacteria bacterium]